VIDIVFSLDSVITAVGMLPPDQVPVMAAAIIIAVLVMIFASNPLGNFIDRHPTVKMLALAFIILVGVALIADGFDVHIDRKFLYFAMAFSAGVESHNRVAGRKQTRRRDLGGAGAGARQGEARARGWSGEVQVHTPSSPRPTCFAFSARTLKERGKSARILDADSQVDDRISGSDAMTPD
jgi:hypothetical protein